MIGTSTSVLVALLLLCAATQILFNLYATSMVTAAAHDAARSVAGFRAVDDRCGATPAATDAFINELGRYGEAGHARIEWNCTAIDVVRIRVSGEHPSILPDRFSGLVPLTAFDRTVEVRTEGAR